MNAFVLKIVSLAHLMLLKFARNVNLVMEILAVIVNYAIRIRIVNSVMKMLIYAHLANLKSTYIMRFVLMSVLPNFILTQICVRLAVQTV